MTTNRTLIDVAEVKAAARGRWREIILELTGLDPELLDGKHHPCPKCGEGDDRFSVFKDFAETGGAICRHCHDTENGDGLATLQWLCGWSFPEALNALADCLGITGSNRTARKRDPLEIVCSRKHMPIEAAKIYGAHLATRSGKQVVRLPVHNAQGEAHSHFDIWVRTDDPKEDKGKLKSGKGSSGVFLPQRDGKPQLPRTGQEWLLVEGPKDAAALHSLGYMAVGTCGCFLPKTFTRLLAGCQVVIVPDRDTPSIDGADRSAANLYGVAASVRIAQLPGQVVAPSGDDVRDVLRQESGEQLVRQVIEDAQEWRPPVPDGGTCERIANYRVTEDAEGEKQTTPLTMKEVLQKIRQATGDWPRNVDHSLFVQHAEGEVFWLNSPAALFGWLASKTGPVRWSRSSGCVSREEVFQELRRTSQRYTAVEELPHDPPLPGHFYTRPTPKPGDGNALAELLDRFCPETPIDRDLIQGMLMTLFWGGPPATRPAFVITSNDGRGAGKSKLAAMAGHLCNGVVDFSSNEDANLVKSRLLSPDALPKRIALLDNVKSHRLSWAELESLITATVVSGKRMYVGEASRPNSIVWLITLNGACLSTDMAQRSVIIKVKAPRRSGTWEEDTIQFIQQRREEIIGDLIGTLRGEPYPLQKFTRWATWERAVMSRLPEPEEAQRVMLERQGEADVEGEESELLEEYFADQLKRLDYDPATDCVHIPNEVAARWYSWAQSGEKVKAATVSRILKQACDEGRLQRIRLNPSRTHGRGFLWFGDQCDGSFTKYDLRERIQARRNGYDSQDA